MAVFKLVVHAAEYCWPSATTHLADCGPSGLLDLTEWGRICPAGEWSGQPAYSNDEGPWAERLRGATRHRRPWGDEDFVHEISKSAGRDPVPGPRGRPRSNGNAATLDAGAVAAAG